MKFEWILDILAVMDAGSLARAAELRSLTQSAFTRRVQTIEQSIGCELFDRSKKPLDLLPHVKNLEKEMRDIVQQNRVLAGRLSDSHNHLTENIRFACQHAISATISPNLVQRIASNKTEAIHVLTGSRDECLLQLLRKEVNFIVIYETTNDGISNEKDVFESILLGYEWLVPVVKICDNIQVSQLIDEGTLPIISYPSEFHLGRLLKQLIIPAIPPEFTITVPAATSLTLAAYEFVRRGVGIGWVPYSLAKPAIQKRELDSLSNILPILRMQVKMYARMQSLESIGMDAWNEIVSKIKVTTARNSVPVNDISLEIR